MVEFNPDISGNTILSIFKEEPVNLDWAVAAKSLCMGDTATIIRWNEINRIPVDRLPTTYLVYDLNKFQPIPSLNTFSRDKIGVGGVLVKVPRLSMARKLVYCQKEDIFTRIFGVLSGYYTCHIPIGYGPSAKAIYRYCLALRQEGGPKARTKQLIKRLIAEAGLGAVLCDYFLVFFRRVNHVY